MGNKEKTVGEASREPSKILEGMALPAPP